ncbi:MULTISPECIES: hypothetical protein [Streptomyces]|uniref:Uncharacterized protein n=1 Tax=Streptomyces luteosporeus TaxID=173856 RepID=A0ABP6GD74_9ACTN
MSPRTALTPPDEGLAIGFQPPPPAADTRALHQLQHALAPGERPLLFLAEAVLLYAACIEAVGGLGRGAGIRRVRVIAFAEAERMALSGQVTDAVTVTSLFRARQAPLGAAGPAV